jgi:hypothetical protein
MIVRWSAYPDVAAPQRVLSRTPFLLIHRIMFRRPAQLLTSHITAG